MTTSANERLNDVLRRGTAVLLTIVLAICGWIGSAVQSMSVNQAVIQSELAEVGRNVRETSLNRYTKTEALADWRVQSLINETLQQSTDDSFERSFSWMDRVGQRLSRVEEAVREQQERTTQ